MATRNSMPGNPQLIHLKHCREKVGSGPTRPRDGLAPVRASFGLGWPEVRSTLGRSVARESSGFQSGVCRSDLNDYGTQIQAPGLVWAPGGFQWALIPVEVKSRSNSNLVMFQLGVFRYGFYSGVWRTQVWFGLQSGSTRFRIQPRLYLEVTQALGNWDFGQA